MKNQAKFYLAIACVIILFDIAASFASRAAQFNYTNLAWVSWGLYVACGYFGCKYRGFLGGVVAGLVAGLSDSTVGWALSCLIGPYLPFAQPGRYAPVLIAVAIVIVTAMGAFFGLVGALLCKITTRGGRRPDA
jgi:hypothetical protein